MKKLLTSIILIATLLFSASCFAGLDPAEEARHAELKKMCHELKVPTPPEIFIRLQVHDRDGKLIFDDRQRGHSWTRNFYATLMSVAADSRGGGSNNFGAGYMSSKSIAGNVYYDNAKGYSRSPSYYTNYIYDAAANSVAGGIVVGTGDTAFSADQYALATLIAHGTGSGQMSYEASTVGALAYTAGTKTWKQTLTRAIINLSGSSITVKETGLYQGHGSSANTGLFGQGYGIAYMVERSVLSPAVEVVNGAALTVTYEISMDFSAID